jgi:hypothetical protein
VNKDVVVESQRRCFVMEFHHIYHELLNNSCWVVQASVLLSALCIKRHTVGVSGWWSSQYCCSNIKSQTDHILASF